MYIAGQSQGMTLNSSQATRPANIIAIPAATGSTAGVRIWQPTTGTIEPYVAGSNSCPYENTPGADQPYGPEAEFARRWVAANPTGQLVIVKLNVGSTPLQKAAALDPIIGCWDPTLANSGTNVNLALLLKDYSDGALAALAAEGKAVTKIGMMWLQGQNDAYYPATAPTYGTALTAFRSWARTNVLGATAPFALAVVENNDNWPNRAPVRLAQFTEANNVANSYLVNTDDLTIGADTFHFAPASTITLGGRFHDTVVNRNVPKAPWDLAMTSPTYAADGVFGQKLTSGYGTALKLPVAAPFTLFARGSISAASGVPQVIAGQNASVFLAIDTSGKLFASIGSGAAVSLTGTTTITGSEFNLAVECGTSGCAIYVNGVSEATTATSFAATDPLTDGGAFEVRTFEPGRPAYSWTGDVTEVAVFQGLRGSLNPTAPFTGSETGLLQLYHLDGSGAD